MSTAPRSFYLARMLVYGLMLALLGCAVEPEFDGMRPPWPRIPVMNFGTFHMDYTPDMWKDDFDASSQENRSALRELRDRLVAFAPTVIVVEREPQRDPELQQRYAEFVASDREFDDYGGEIGLVAFALGKAAGVERIYGIDHQMGYNYRIGEQLEAPVERATYQRYVEWVQQTFRDEGQLQLPLLDKLRRDNSDAYLDFLINLNADILTYVNTRDGFEGVDEATLFYQRNLRMFANLNKLDLRPSDRVFLLMGAAHTAFFRDLLHHSPRYEQVRPGEWLR